MNIAVQALANIRLHAGFATNLSRDVGLARKFIGQYKRVISSVAHSDIGEDALGVDVGLINAGFTIIENLEDDELVAALVGYGASFTDSSATILSLRKQLEEILPKLRADKAALAAELAKYQENEGWLIDQTIQENNQFTARMISSFAQVATRQALPSDMADEPIVQELSLQDVGAYTLIAESLPIEGSEKRESGREDMAAAALRGGVAHGLMTKFVRADRSGLFTVDEELLFPDAYLENGGRIAPELSWSDLDSLLANFIESGKFSSLIGRSGKIGQLLGFLNALEVEDEKPSTFIQELAHNYVTTLTIPLTGVEELVLPYLTNNGFIRRQIDQTTGQPLDCRIRSYGVEPGKTKSTHSSTYVALLCSTEDPLLWSVQLIPIGKVIKNERTLP